MSWRNNPIRCSLRFYKKKIKKIMGWRCHPVLGGRNVDYHIAKGNRFISENIMCVFYILYQVDILFFYRKMFFFFNKQMI